MGYPTKIATCCYCGTRAALKLDRVRHELACARCGAPLHDMKMLRMDKAGDREMVPGSAIRTSKPVRTKASKPKKTRKSSKSFKKRKARFWDILDDAFDIVEDIFD